MLVELEINVWKDEKNVLKKKIVLFGVSIDDVVEILRIRGVNIEWVGEDMFESEIVKDNSDVTIDGINLTNGEGIIVVPGDRWVVEAIIDKVLNDFIWKR